MQELHALEAAARELGTPLQRFGIDGGVAYALLHDRVSDEELDRVRAVAGGIEVLRVREHERRARRPRRGGGDTAEAAAVRERYVGLSLDEVEALASSEGRAWRIGSRDGEEHMLTMDLRHGRVTVDVVDDRVVDASVEWMEGA